MRKRTTESSVRHTISLTMSEVRGVLLDHLMSGGHIPRSCADKVRFAIYDGHGRDGELVDFWWEGPGQCTGGSDEPLAPEQDVN